MNEQRAWADYWIHGRTDGETGGGTDGGIEC